MVQIIDQRVLPHEYRVHDLHTWQDADTAIADMYVRGAPLIGATAAWGLYLAALANPSADAVRTAAGALLQSRPTAVNLRWAVERILRLVDASGDNLVENNLIINCDRGIGFGLNSRGNTGGTIQNNMIYHAANRGTFADTGISIHNSPGTNIYNNTIFMEHGYPTAIEYRFDGTSGVSITNNLTNKSISSLDGGSGVETANYEDAQAGWFINVTNGDLHLSGAVPELVDQGQSLSTVGIDFDGEPRPQGAGFDIGADEFSSVTSVRPMSPTNLVAQ